MRNGEYIRYPNRWLPVKLNGEWVLIEPGGGRLTAVPIVKRKKIGFFRKLWLTYSPEWWKRRIRHKSHKNFLKKADPTGEIFSQKVKFGSPEHIAAEKQRILTLFPPTENEFGFSWLKLEQDRRDRLRDVLRAAFKEHS